MERTDYELNKLADIAGLNKRKEMVQTLTFVTDLSESQFGLIEIPNELLNLFHEGESFVIRGDIHEEAILCTKHASYEIRAADTSNALLLLPSLQTPHLKEFEENRAQRADANIVCSLSSYYELKKVKPRLSKLRQILGKTLYHGPEHESDSVDDKVLNPMPQKSSIEFNLNISSKEKCKQFRFVKLALSAHQVYLYTFDDLSCTIQASDREVRAALDRIYAFQLNGFWRILDIGYKEKAFSQILKLVEEERWELDEIPLERTCEILQDLYPREVLQNCLEIHGEISACEGTPDVIYRLSEERVCQFVAECILRGAGKFNYYEFLEAWQQSVPDGLQTSKEQLRSVEDVGGYIKYHNNITANREYFVNHTLHLKPTMPPRNEPLYFSPATWYLFSMIGFFFLTALLHGFEFTGLIHGIWYLLCLPSGYLLLVIYSAANLTDRSWGTREKKIVSNEQSNWFETLSEYFRYFCWCCIPPSKRPKEEEPVDERQTLVNESDDEYGKDEQSNSVCILP